MSRLDHNLHNTYSIGDQKCKQSRTRRNKNKLEKKNEKLNGVLMETKFTHQKILYVTLDFLKYKTGMKKLNDGYFSNMSDMFSNLLVIVWIGDDQNLQCLYFHGGKERSEEIDLEVLTDRLMREWDRDPEHD